ncbi:MAG: DUF1549 domain-containing protein, partial [Candidatus Hydrogenedentes bacterium]|nr:DUF1549 domain-containing protein [Candidatus Hydrogenedentota bacterium]
MAMLFAIRNGTGIFFCAFLVSIAPKGDAESLAASNTPSVAFNRDVLPILSDNCFACHGPDEPARKAGLRLDVEEGAKQVLPSGSVAVVPGDSRASALMHRIATSDAEDQMPPPETGKALSEGERTLLGRWIAEGANWEQHWAFIVPERPPLPAVHDSSWSLNPIDRFILARLEAEGMGPSSEADRHTLIRRVSLDLTGLPPSSEEVARFVSNSDPGAYAALVDRLLASPRYGEHMARYWLDLARYADTNGYAADIGRTMWRYRDWVIDAFNANMPFDQFTIEQLAGDLLPNPTLEQRIATGFNRNHPIMMEGGAIFEEYRVGNVVDRVDTTATTWLGLTMKCAQCHDHKYDPISQREFYECYAFFNNVTEKESKLFGTELDGNSLPRIKAPLATQQAAKSRLEGALAEVRAEKLRSVAEIDAAQQIWEQEERAAIGVRWMSLDGAIAPVSPDAEQSANVAVLGGDTTLRDITALRLDLLPTAVGDTEASFALSALELFIAPVAGGVEEKRVLVAESAASVADVKLAHDGNPETVWSPESAAPAVSAVFSVASPLGIADGTRVRVVLRGKGIAVAADRVRLSVSSDPAFLPATLGPWHVNGPYPAENGDEAMASEYVDPKQIDLSAAHDDGRAKWVAPPNGLPDGKAHRLSGKMAATYLHRCITAPSPRRMDIALDNRNAVRLWVNGRMMLDKKAQRGEVGAHPAPLNIALHEGENSILIKTVDYYDFNNPTFFFARKGEEVGRQSLRMEAALLLDSGERTQAQQDALRTAYRSQRWEGWAPLHERELDLAWALSQLDKEVPTTMVMEEMTEPRSAHVLIRGQYDQPGTPVFSGVPAALHSWPGEASPD